MFLFFFAEENGGKSERGIASRQLDLFVNSRIKDFRIENKEKQNTVNQFHVTILERGWFNRWTDFPVKNEKEKKDRKSDDTRGEFGFI